MRTNLAVCTLLLLLGSAPAGAEDDPASFLPYTPTEWLVIAPVDFRTRRPFNPDAVFARHLLDPASPPPKEGETLIGERGEKVGWSKVAADSQGEVGGDLAYAYTTVEAPGDMIAMAWLRSGGTLFVNGTPYAGAIYGDRFEVPVRLVKGTNHVYVKGVRGAFRLTFTQPPAGIFLAPWRQTKPDLVAGEPCDTVCGLLVVNAREQELGQALWESPGNEWLAPMRSEGVLPIASLDMVQIRVPLKTKPGKTVPLQPGAFQVPIHVRGAYAAEGEEATFTLDVRERTRAVIRTFVSDIDDSVQAFGIREPQPGGKGPTGLVLTLHGAGVNPRAQVDAYGPRDDFWIVAPTNRDRFGFDWQDWGRLDAYEVLARGLGISGVDRSRVYLTGHSMGGHGTWHLGANDPDGFAAIAPSAGWISFDTYPSPRREGELTSIWHAADAASKTRDLLDNLVQLPTFILHGERDDNVPVEQAREMEKLLTAAGAKPQVHYEPGVKHWWDGHPEPGAQCVDWPGIFDLFRKTRIDTAPKEIHFKGVHPSVDSRHHWLEVLTLKEYGKPFEVRGTYDAERQSLEITTHNAADLRLTPPGLVRSLRIDGRGVEYARPGDQPTSWIGLDRSRGRLPDDSKRPARGGPFRQAFTNRFVFVRGTRGSPEMTRALLEQARFDAQRWMYRANGQGVVLTDAAWLASRDSDRLAGRNVILYGSNSTNSAYALLDRARATSRGWLQLRDWPKAAGYHVWPADTPDSLAAFCTARTPRESRLGLTPMLFISGAGWPDYVLFDADILTRGDEGVVEAGWFDAHWSLQPVRYIRDPAGSEVKQR